VSSELVDVAALGPGGEYRTRKTELIADTAGQPVVKLSLVPRLFVTRAIATQRTMRPLPTRERAAALTLASELFVTERIAGLDFDGYVELTQRISGLPREVAFGKMQAMSHGAAIVRKELASKA